MKDNLLRLGLAAWAIPGCVIPQVTGTPTQTGMEGLRPNILFIFADDWGFGDLSAHGHKGLTTPNLDKLISQGTDYMMFNVCNPVSSPSRTAVVTGHFPSRHGIHEHIASHESNQQRGMPDWLDPHVVLLPRLLQQSGYRTAHYGKWHLSNDMIVNAPLPVLYGYDDTRVFNGSGPQVESGPKEYPSSAWTANCVNYTIDFIKKDSSKPFYINLWIHETHQKIEPSPEQRKPYLHLPEPQQSYYSVVTAADRELGRLFDYLREAGLEENTLVIFSSDNGPEHNSFPSTWSSVGETAGLRARKRSLYEGGIKVPFIVRLPGRVAAGVVDAKSKLAAVDILPTFCALAGVELPEGYLSDGENILPALAGKEFVRTKPVLQFWQGNAGGDNWPRLAITLDQWKLLMNYDGSRIELYDHFNDWGEQNNVAAQHPEVVAKLKPMILDYYNSLPLINRP